MLYQFSHNSLIVENPILLLASLSTSFTVTNQVPLDRVNGIKQTCIVPGKPKRWSTPQDDDQVATK